MRLIKISLFVLFAFSAINATAQKRNRKVSSATAFKPPKLFTGISSYSDSAIINAGEAESIISMPLAVTDGKKNVYTVTSYQFLYKQNVVTEDEESGKASAATSIVSDRFISTPLPEMWVNKVRADLKPGEELYFFDIIVKDMQGRVMYAPTFKITVQ